MRARSIRALLLIALMLRPSTAAAQEADTGAASVSWRFFLKSSALLSNPPDNPALASGQPQAAGFLRVRLEPQIRVNGPVAFDLAVEQRLQVRSSTAGAAAMIAPSGGGAPYRVSQLDWTLGSSANSEMHVEIDRAAVRLRLPRVELTAGRQAIGWGRGALFGAVDLFAPFTPLEVDREWRRGVDAVRAEVWIGERVSFDAVAAFDRRFAASIGAARVRGYTRRLDVELLGGIRAGEAFAGAIASAPAGPMEFHADGALFRADGNVTGKLVAGGSYRLPLAKGIYTAGEYHYSGFGASTAAGIAATVMDPTFRARYLRGDTQILGRHMVAALASYEHSPAHTIGVQWIHSPTDNSGVLTPSITYTIDDRWSALFTGYLPYGRGQGEALTREFGGAPFAVFLQVRMYR